MHKYFHKYLSSLVVYAFALSVTACGNLFHEMPDLSEDNIPADKTKPGIVYTYPPDKGRDIELDKAIIATFNKEMDTSTIHSSTFIVKKLETIISGNQTTTVETVLNGNIAIHNNRTILFRLKNSGKMDALSHFSVTATNEIKDTDNLHPDENYTWTFNTSDKEDNTGPEVISTEPLSYVYTTENITARAVFNEDIDPFSVSDSTCIFRKVNADNSTTPVPGTVSYEAATKTVLYAPDNPIEVSASYEVVLIAGENGIKDLSENSLQSNRDWNFRHLITYDLPCEIPGLEDLDCCE